MSPSQLAREADVLNKAVSAACWRMLFCPLWAQIMTAPAHHPQPDTHVALGGSILLFCADQEQTVCFLQFVPWPALMGPLPPWPPWTAVSPSPHEVADLASAQRLSPSPEASPDVRRTYSHLLHLTTSPRGYPVQRRGQRFWLAGPGLAPEPAPHGSATLGPRVGPCIYFLRG